MALYVTPLPSMLGFLGDAVRDHVREQLFSNPSTTPLPSASCPKPPSKNLPVNSSFPPHSPKPGETPQTLPKSCKMTASTKPWPALGRPLPTRVSAQGQPRVCNSQPSSGRCQGAKQPTGASLITEVSPQSSAAPPTPRITISTAAHTAITAQPPSQPAACNFGS